MKLSRETMLERMYASDKSCNGRFLTGVLSTGIYCLPSCPARKPKAENVRFFLREEEAQQAGLRACRRCRPDAFYRNCDPDLEALLALTTRMRREPNAFADVADMAKESEIGATKLNALFRRHYHATPAGFLNQARIAEARRLLSDPQSAGMNALEIAFEVGYESLSAFHENFRKLTGMGPAEYRKIGKRTTFALALPQGYRSEYPLRNLGRDAQSPLERVRGNRISKALALNGQAALLHLTLCETQVVCEAEAPSGANSALMFGAHAAATRLLGLASDPAPFERKLESLPE